MIGSSCVDIDNCSQDEEETRRTSYYYMIGPTAAAFILPLLATILSYFIVELLIMFGKDEVEKKNQDTNSETDGVELVQLPADVVTRGESKKKKILAEFHTYAITEVHQADFNNLKCGALSMLFLAVLFFMLALLGGRWHSMCVVCVQVQAYVHCMCAGVSIDGYDSYRYRLAFEEIKLFGLY